MSKTTITDVTGIGAITGGEVHQIINNYYNNTNSSSKPFDLKIEEMKRIGDELINKFSANGTKLKEGILEFVDAWDLSFNSFLRAESFVELFAWLLENRECLGCFLKASQIKVGNSLELSLKDSDCKARKDRASQSQTISDVFFKIRPSIGRNIEVCEVSGWLKYKSNKYLPIILENTLINFSEKGDFITKFPNALAKILKGRNYDELGLNLILHESLFHIDFQNLEIELEEELGSFMDYFSISTEFEFRHSNYDKPIPEISRWIKNSSRYETYQELEVKPLIYSLSKEKPSKLFGKRFGSSKCVLLLSDYSLLDANLRKVLKYGIPNFICPQSSSVAYNVDDWNDILVKNMKEIGSNCVDVAFENEQNLHFLYNNYKRVEALHLAINNIAHDTDYDNLKEG